MRDARSLEKLAWKFCKERWFPFPNMANNTAGWCAAAARIQPAVVPFRGPRRYLPDGQYKRFALSEPSSDTSVGLTLAQGVCFESTERARSQSTHSRTPFQGGDGSR